MAFLKQQRPLPSLQLCGNPLPWTDKVKHLGITITNKIDGCEEDLKIKNAMYVEKNIELNQEFFFAHPRTKIKVNSIYNSHFTSSPLWNLFGNGAKKIISSYNRSIKSMMDLPLATHRSLIEPITDCKHISKILVNRFLSFVEKISLCSKKAIKMLLETSSNDVRSVTGTNLREIMLLVGKTRVTDVCRGDGDLITYFDLKTDDIWKVQMIKELIDIKHSSLEVEQYGSDELETILFYLCTS